MIEQLIESIKSVSETNKTMREELQDFSKELENRFMKTVEVFFLFLLHFDLYIGGQAFFFLLKNR